MAETGIICRRDTKANLELNKPILGELVFSTDTEEHGWVVNGELVWKDLNETIEIPELDKERTLFVPCEVHTTSWGTNYGFALDFKHETETDFDIEFLFTASGQALGFFKGLITANGTFSFNTTTGVVSNVSVAGNAQSGSNSFLVDFSSTQIGHINSSVTGQETVHFFVFRSTVNGHQAGSIDNSVSSTKLVCKCDRSITTSSLEFPPSGP